MSVRPHVHRLLVPVAVLVALLAVGTVGYQLVEGWGWFDALYMTAITITTVGFLEVHPMGAGGRVFTMVLALGGVFTAFYAAAEFIRAVVTGEIRTVLGRQRMESRLEKLSGHFVVCGFGRMGRLVAEEFSSAGLPFVVVDRDPKVLEGFDIPHGIPLVGDATADDVLRRAGVERARALVTAAASDADNLFITMSARLLNERLVHRGPRGGRGGGGEAAARRGEPRRLPLQHRRAPGGPGRPAPERDGLHRARHPRRPPRAADRGGRGRARGARSSAASIKASPIRSELGIIIVAIKKPGGKMAFNPSPDAVLEAGDLLITLGHRQQLDRLEADGRRALSDPRRRRARGHGRPEDEHDARDVGPEHERHREGQRAVERRELHAAEVPDEGVLRGLPEDRGPERGARGQPQVDAGPGDEPVDEQEERPAQQQGRRLRRRARDEGPAAPEAADERG